MNMKNRCRHEDIEWYTIRIMINPDVKYGKCKMCGRLCRKIDGKISWEKINNESVVNDIEK